MSTEKLSIGAEARNLLLKNSQGILSTNSVEMSGYPFGSVVPYCLDQTGNPIILISRIAQHTKNIITDQKVSLITIEAGDDIQVGGRLTWVADAKLVEDDEELIGVADRYFRYFPQSRDYHKVHDFAFYRLELVRARYIAGFGKIHWIDAEKVLLPNVFSMEQELGMIDHMNQDHFDAMKKYCLDAEIKTDLEGLKIEDLQMAGIDEEGFDLRLKEKIIRFTFSEPANSADEIRARLVEMARS